MNSKNKEWGLIPLIQQIWFFKILNFIKVLRKAFSISQRYQYKSCLDHSKRQQIHIKPHLSIQKWEQIPNILMFLKICNSFLEKVAAKNKRRVNLNCVQWPKVYLIQTLLTLVRMATNWVWFNLTLKTILVSSNMEAICWRQTVPCNKWKLVQILNTMNLLIL